MKIHVYFLLFIINFFVLIFGIIFITKVICIISYALKHSDTK